MISFIRHFTQAFGPPDQSLVCPKRLWRSLVQELDRRGGRKHEAGAFLLGNISGERRSASAVVFYDDLDPKSYASGVCILDGNAFGRLWAICRERKLTVVADVHTHPAQAFQSISDRTNPMVAQAGHVAIILPDFAQAPIDLSKVGVFQYRGSHLWTDRSPTVDRHFLHINRWR